MARTTTTLVQAVLGDDYDGSKDITPFIDAANAIVSRVSTCATRKAITLSTTELELIERWLAAHLYCCSDKTYTSKSTGGASGSFSGQTGQGFDATLYGQTAMRMDASNCLENIDKTQTARGIWLGKPPSSQIDYTERD